MSTVSKSLSDSIDSRPIPLDSAASAFLQSVEGVGSLRPALTSTSSSPWPSALSRSRSSSATATRYSRTTRDASRTSTSGCRAQATSLRWSWKMRRFWMIRSLRTRSCNGKISETTLPGYPKFVLYASDSYNNEISVARNAAKAIACASKEDYDDMPAYKKNLVVWEELQEAAVKINSFFSRQKLNDAFNQDELEKWGLGEKQDLTCCFF